MKKEKGNMGNLFATGLCMLALTVLMFSYLNFVKVLQQKEQVSQIARKYILRMETVGMLTVGDELALREELAGTGATELSLEGSTTWPVVYGESIVLQIEGRLEGGYEFFEKRVSTAKH